jgi:hypothetical protein
LRRSKSSTERQRPAPRRRTSLRAIARLHT